VCRWPGNRLHPRTLLCVPRVRGVPLAG
jgi:hypothetical protein